MSKTVWRNLSFNGKHYRYTTEHSHGAATGLVLVEVDSNVKRVIPLNEVQAFAKDAGLGEIITHGSKHPVIVAPAVVAVLRAFPDISTYQPRPAIV